MIPMEIGTLIGSTLVGGLLKLWSKSQENNFQNHKMALEAAGLKRKSVEDARKWQLPAMAWTRRVIALSVIGAVVILPKVITILNPEVPVFVGYTEAVKQGWWIFSSSSDVTLWEPLKGLVITPLDSHLAASICGFYFGGSLTK